jgi:hypothetical protein
MFIVKRLKKDIDIKIKNKIKYDYSSPSNIKIQPVAEISKNE